MIGKVRQKGSLWKIVAYIVMIFFMVLTIGPLAWLLYSSVKPHAQIVREVRDQGVAVLLIEQNAALALELADYGYVMENGKIVLDGDPKELAEDRDFQEFYLGIGAEGRRSYADVKLYRRKKRWLS